MNKNPESSVLENSGCIMFLSTKDTRFKRLYLRYHYLHHHFRPLIHK